MKKLIFSLLVITSLMLMVLGSVSANTHDSDVTVIADGWLIPDTTTDFTVEITNNGPDSIRKVVIYLPVPSFVCGDAPTDWIRAVGSDSCTYSTFSDFIISGGSKEFTLQATTSSDLEDVWLVTTKDVGDDPNVNSVVPIGQTIQDAIDDADSDDVIEVPAGEYDEFVHINKHITLVSSDGAESTTINKGIRISADDVTVEGFTILPDLILGEIAGIYLDGDLDTVTMENNEINGEGISGSRGILVKIGADYTDVSIKNNEIHDCTTGIYTNPHTGVIDIENNEIYNTLAGIGGFTGANVIGNIFHDNDEAVGADTSITGSDYELKYNHFLGDHVNAYGGASIVAKENWWGDLDPSDQVSGDVEFDPWCYDAECSPDTTAPTIKFIGEPYFSLVDVEITITVDLSDMRDIANYTIEFGDGENETGEFNGNHDTEEQINVKHMYDGEDEYIVKLTVTDATGNSASETTVVLVSAEKPDWIISLSTRMNLISIPLVPKDIAIGKVFKEIRSNVEIVWSYQYDETTGENEWKWAEPKGSGWDTDKTLDSITPGYGYIVFMEEYDVLYGNGKELEVETPPEVVLTTGWNLIGHYGLNDLPVNDAFSSLELGNDFYWNSVLTVNDEGGLESVDKLEPTEAYWLSIKGINMEEPDETRFFRYLPSQKAY